MSREIICTTTGEVAYSYKTYLATAHWKMTRDRCIEACAGICMKCKQKRRNLQIHHKYYDTLGFEQNCDLVPLCASCHASEHENIEMRIKALRRVKLREARFERKSIKAGSWHLKEIHACVGHHKGGIPVALCAIKPSNIRPISEEVLFTNEIGEVTCKHCVEIYNNIYSGFDLII